MTPTGAAESSGGPRRRCVSRSSGPAAVEADYEKTADELSRAQLALDAVNQRDTFELAE